jgi:hypothetical protein
LLGGTEENHKKSVRIVGLRAEILTRDLPNTKQECSSPDQDVRIIYEETGLSSESEYEMQ